MSKNFECKIIIIFLLIKLFVWGAQKNRLIETVLLSTHKICYGLQIQLWIHSYLEACLFWVTSSLN